MVMMLVMSMMAGCGKNNDNQQNTPAGDTGSGTASTQAPAKSDDGKKTGDTAKTDTPAVLTLEDKLAEAAKMTDEQLYEKAKEETGTMTVYSTTSLGNDALTWFLEKYPGLKAEMSVLDEGDVFTKVTTEVGSSADGADMVLIQNAYRMQNEMISEGLLLNYFPDAYKSAVAAEYQDPCAILFVAKLLFTNHTGDAADLKNVWELTEPSQKGNIYFKNPENEAVGMNFLIMLTSPEWEKKLGDAYKSYFGSEWNNTGAYKSVSYEFLDKFLANCNYTYAADGGICTGLAEGAPGSVGLFVFSKLRSNELARANLTIAACGNDGKGIEGFAGFMYPTYAMVCSDTDMPYTSALYINYLLSAEGGAAWNNENNMGSYLANTSIPLVPDATGLDREATFWIERTVIEDGAYLAEHYAEVYEFIAMRTAQ